MFASVLDRRLVRAGLVALGVPVTAAGLIGAIYIPFFLIGGLQGNLFVLGLGALGVLGLLGLVGAWTRVLRRHDLMSKKVSLVVRVLLACGVASAAALGVWALLGGWMVAALGFWGIAVGGLVLIWGTPVAV